MAGATDVRRKLHNYAKNGRNWRLAGLMLAHPDVPSGYTEQDVARAWPKAGSESDYRFLSANDADIAPRFSDKKSYTVTDTAEEQLGYSRPDAVNPKRQLSDGGVKDTDWHEGPFGDDTIPADRAIKRSLAFEDSIANLDVLFRKEIRDTVIAGARKAEIARDAATVFDVDRQQGDHPRGQDTQFAPKVAEGGAIQDDADNMDTVSWDTEKHGQGARATDELLNQSLVDVVAQQVEFLGHSCEMALNRIWLNELIDNVDTNNDVDASSENNRGVAAVNEAIHQIELSDHTPDTTVQHPTFTKTLFDTAESNAIIPFANEFGDDEGIRDRVAFPLLGVEGFRGSDGVYDPSGSNTWDYTANDETGAVVYDRDLVGLYLFRDVEVKEYEDPIRDLQGVNARIEGACSWHQPDAGARIQYGVS